MSREEVPPTETQDGDRTRLTHPAFGQMSIFKTSGSKNLYGSDFAHQHYVSIELHTSELERNLAHDWKYQKKRLFRINLSESQWATFVSSFSVGGGVPVTLEEVLGERMPDIPLRDEARVYRREKDDKLQLAVNLIKDAIEAVKNELASVPMKKKQPVLDRLTALEREFSLNLPFVAKSFDEHMESRIEKAKIEVHAYINSAITQAGLEVLRGASPFQLENMTASDTEESS